MGDFVAVSRCFAYCSGGADGGGFALSCNVAAGYSWWGNGAALTLSLFGNNKYKLKYSYIIMDETWVDNVRLRVG